MVKSTPVPVREGEPRLAVTVIEDVTEVKRAELAERFLAQAGAVLASALDYEQTLAKVAELAVPRLADWCSVSLPDGNRLRPVAAAHVDPAKVAFARAYQERYPTSLDEPSGAPQVLRDGTSLMHQPRRAGALAAPAPTVQRAELPSSGSAPRWSCRWSPPGT